mmetsp:Transcript_12560/g.39866  ORF Transcript_12560/g.39866 Transcript_12560/m.39866 type:complete len:316 (+) Transcript_12560:40-987(+)
MAAAASLKKAQELEARGERALSKFSFFGGGSKFEDAAECFDDAGKMYVMAKSFDSAGRVYGRAAELHVKAKSEFDAATSQGKAAEAYQKAGEVAKCVEWYERSVATYAGMGKCSMAANSAKKLGELLEQRGEPRAVEMFRQAVDLYESEGRPQAATGCREKVGYLSAEVGNYAEAQSVFEEMGRAALQSNLGKFNAKKWFTNAVLCALARDDVVAAGNKFSEFRALDYSFDGTREAMLCEALLQAVDANDHEAVAAAAADYDKIKRLDPWMTKILLAIKNSLAPPLGADDPDADTIPPDDAPPDEDEAEDLPDLT